MEALTRASLWPGEQVEVESKPRQAEALGFRALPLKVSRDPALDGIPLQNVGPSSSTPPDKQNKEGEQDRQKPPARGGRIRDMPEAGRSINREQGQLYFRQLYSESKMNGKPLLKSGRLSEGQGVVRSQEKLYPKRDKGEISLKLSF